MLGRLLDSHAATRDTSVVVGPKVGLDAAAVAVDAGVLVVASDPVTYAADRIGWYAVHVNANDIFVCGAEPKWLLADILLPPGQARAAENILAEIHQACDELGVLLIGGHTEMTPDLPRPIVAGFMIGRAVGERVLTAAGVRQGDVIILTKGVAVEGTAVIAREFEGKLLEKLPRSVVRRSRRFLEDPGISVRTDARIALQNGAGAMHDPTEGGLLNGLWEMSRASGLAFHIDADRVNVFPETRAVCEYLDINPLGLLASGALLLSCAEKEAGNLLKAFASRDLAAAVIGQARAGSPGVYLKGGKTLTEDLPDEILKVFVDPTRQRAG